MNRIVTTDCTDPYENLALEDALFSSREGSGATLYLWQNERTVVIGRNQNAWRECRTELLQAEGGRLARRTTGGGAVFHDLGNLNFTFLLPRADYDLPKQMEVVRRAVARFGVLSAFTGRNDLVLSETGAKFSGNAFRFTKETGMQHGTLLVSADMERLSRYLAPSKRKLEAKGVSSVISRVTNLASCSQEVTIPALRAALIDTFTELYGKAEHVCAETRPCGELKSAIARFSSWEWLYGATPAFNASFETRFDWGCVELLLNVKHGSVESARCFTDAMDETLASRAENALLGATYDAASLAQRLAGLGEETGETLADWMRGQTL